MDYVILAFSTGMLTFIGESEGERHQSTFVNLQAINVWEQTSYI